MMTAKTEKTETGFSTMPAANQQPSKVRFHHAQVPRNQKHAAAPLHFCVFLTQIRVRRKTQAKSFPSSRFSNTLFAFRINKLCHGAHGCEEGIPREKVTLVWRS